MYRAHFALVNILIMIISLFAEVEKKVESEEEEDDDMGFGLFE